MDRMFFVVVLLALFLVLLPLGESRSIIGTLRMGQMDVTAAVAANPSQTDLVMKNTICGDAIYPTLNRYEHIDTDRDYIRITKWYSHFQIFATANRHALWDSASYDEPIYPYATNTGAHFETNTRFCAYLEPINGNDRAAKPTHNVSIDWMLTNDFVGTDAGQISILILMNPGLIVAKAYGVYCLTYHMFSGYILNPRIILSAPYHLHTDYTVMDLTTFIDRVATDHVDTCMHFGTGSEEINSTIQTGFTTTILYGQLEDNHTGDPMEGGHLYFFDYPMEEKLEKWSMACIDYAFKTTYNVPPYVFITPSFRHKPSYIEYSDPIGAWLENKNENGFRACISRTRVDSPTGEMIAEPSLEYLVMPVDGPTDQESELLEMTESYLLTLSKFDTASYSVFSTKAFNVFMGDNMYPLMMFFANITDTYIGQWHIEDIAFRHNDLTAKIYLGVTPTINDPGFVTRDEVVSKLNTYFANGEVPFVTNVTETSVSQRAFSDLVYSGENPDNVSITIRREGGCVSKPLQIADACTVTSCVGTESTNNGKLSMFSGPKYGNSETRLCAYSSAANPLKLFCNQGPCSRTSSVEMFGPSSSADLMWLLWAVVGIAAAVIVIGGSYMLFKRGSRLKKAGTKLIA